MIIIIMWLLDRRFLARCIRISLYRIAKNFANRLGLLYGFEKGEDMLEILNFIFRDFWTFCGVVILLYVVGVYCIAAPLSAIACIFNKDSDKKEK